MRLTDEEIREKLPELYSLDDWKRHLRLGEHRIIADAQIAKCQSYYASPEKVREELKIILTEIRSVKGKLHSPDISNGEIADQILSLMGWMEEQKK